MSIINTYVLIKFDEIKKIPKRQGWNEWSITMLPYGPELRRSRQKLHQFLQQSVIPDYHPLLAQSAYRLAELLLRNPNSFVGIVKLYVKFSTKTQFQ